MSCYQSLDYFIDYEQDLEIDENEPEESVSVEELDDESEESESTQTEGETSQSFPSSPIKKPRVTVSLVSY